MRFIPLISLIGLLFTSASAQTREAVTFRYEGAPVGKVPFVSGSLPELGGSDLGRSIELLEVSEGVWEVDIELPVNRNYAHQIFLRRVNPIEVPDSTLGEAVGDPVAATTAIVALEPASKTIRYDGTIAEPVIHWRQDEDTYEKIAMSAGGRWFLAQGIGEANKPVEFFFTDADESVREPAALGGAAEDDPAYAMRADDCYVQDGEVFVYEPAEQISAPRRDYDLANLPTVDSQILGSARPYRVFLPRGYDEHPDRYYPVVYFADGQALFEDLDTNDILPKVALDPDGAVLSSLMASGQMHEVIAIGIDEVHRNERWSHYSVLGTVTTGQTGIADQYADFLRLELMPRIAADYRVLDGAENTAFVGYQLGGTLALYLGWDFPEYFGKVAAFSPDANAALEHVFRLEAKRDARMYVDSGFSLFSRVRELRNTFLSKTRARYAIGEQFRYVFAHEMRGRQPADMLARFPQALPFLFPAEEPLDADRTNAATPYWLKAFGLTSTDWDLDNDNDGWSTRVEYAFGTSPVDGSVFPVMDVEIVDDEALFHWQSQPGVTYQLEKSDNLDQWEDYGDPIVGTGDEFEGVVALHGDDTHFYVRMNVSAPVDTDRDGLTDVEEAVLLETDPFDTDTDRDGFKDGDEVLFNGTDPLVPDITGGSIAGGIYIDQIEDGMVAGDGAAPGAVAFLDLDYDRKRSANEPFETASSDGGYKFDGIAPGTYHVMQELPAGWVQTVPGGVPGTPDGLPDTFVSFDHSGEGTFPEPYGLNATSTIGVPIVELGRDVELVDPELLLKPIGLRGDTAPIGVYTTNELVSLSKNSSVTVKFEDEEIIDGPGADLAIVSLGSAQAAGERIDIYVGATADDLVYVATADEGGNIGIDLGRVGIDYPVQYVKVTSLNNKGSFPGFELVGFEAIHFVPADTSYHRVTVKSNETVEGVDFGRVGRDRAPRAFITMETGRVKAGGTFDVQVSASDDFGVASVALKANGSPVALDGEGNGTVTAQWPGELLLAGEATDSAGQTGDAILNVYVVNADGSVPADPNIPSLEERSAGAPEIRIQTPGSGAIVDADVDVVASITDDSLTRWQFHYAPVADIDPYNLSADDSDYVLLSEGSEVVVNTSLGLLPASTLSDGIYFVRVSATGGGLTSYSGHAFGVRVDPSELFPSIAITAPENGDEVTFVTDVIGSISSEQSIREWFVEVALASEIDVTNLGKTAGVSFTRIADGTGVQEPGSVLAKFDSTLLENNSYVIKVTAWNDIGLGWTEGVLVNVCGDTKLGRLRTEFTDLVIDLAGVPIEIKRVYDSFASKRSGDFGYGWSIGYADPQLDETDSDGGLVFSAKAWKPGTRVYLNSPSGQRVGFTFGLELVSTGFIGSSYRAVFTPDPGVYETLEVPEGDAGFLAQNSAGEAVLSFISLPYNPDEFILTTKEGIRYTYTESDGLIDVRDEAGNVLTFSEDGIRHTSGVSVDFTRDAAGRITRITGPGGQAWVYGYDVGGDLVSVADPGGVTTTLSYFADPAHYLEKIVDPLGRTGVQYEYDEDGRLVAKIDENGNRSEEIWDLEGFSGSISDYRGNVTTLRYDARGNIIREELPNGGAIVRAYGDPANPDLESAVTDPNGNITRYTYDTRGNQTGEQPPVGRGYFNQFNEANKITQRKFPDLRTEDLTYGDNGKVTELAYSGSARRTYVYDANGNIASETDVEGMQTFYEYGGIFGQLNVIEDQNGNRGEIVYDSRGLPSLVRNAFGGETGYTFDDSGQMLMETDPYGNATIATYPIGQLATITDPDGMVTRLSYDASTKLTMENIGGAVSEYAYDPDGNRISVADPVGNTTTMVYDAGNKLLTSTDANGQVMTHTYDPAGNRVQTVDRNGRKRSFEYDEMNRMVAERWHDVTSDAVVHEIRMTYNRDQKLTSATDGNVEYAFINLVSPEVTNFRFTFPGLEQRSVLYSYANNTEVTEVKYGVARYHQYRRSESRDVNVIHMLSPDSGFSARLDVLRAGDGSPEALWRYNTSSVLANQDAIISRTAIGYDLIGRALGITHSDATGATYANRGAFIYTRNAMRNIATADDGSNVATYAYDGRRQVSGVVNSSRADESFSYDLNGNRNGAGYVTGMGNRLTQAGAFEFDWDNEGNLIQRRDTATGEVTDLTWDFRNRLIRVETRPSAEAAPEKAVDYIYDHRDLRIGRTENGLTTWTFYGTDEMPLYEFAGDDPSPAAVFYYLPDQYDRFVGEWRRDKGMRWFLTDDLGSVRAIADAEGTQIATLDYDAFGNTIAITETTPGDSGSIRFAGRHFDATTGFYYNRARWYDPTIGRFLSEDPIGFDGGDRNLYRYAGNDPVNFADPTGNTAAVSYSTFTEKIAKRTIKYAKKIGRQLDECFRGIAESLESAASGSGRGGNVSACKKTAGIP